MAFREITEVADHIADKLKAYSGPLGIEDVIVSDTDDELVFNYPGVIITYGSIRREIHSTRTYLVEWPITLWVYHAEVNKSRTDRLREDTLLAGAIRDFLHEDYTMGGNIIFGYVVSETPGILTRKNRPVVGTRVDWVGQGRTPMFKEDIGGS